MAETRSTMIPLGTKVPEFRLLDTHGKMIAQSDFTGASALVVLFICNHCPYVKHIQAQLVQLGRDFIPKGVAIVAISSNDAAAYPQDGPAQMAKTAEDAHFPFPYLYDESQQVAKAFGAVCTPDIFVFDRESKLVYRGQFDDSRPGNAVPVTGRDLRAAIEATLEGKSVSLNQKPSVGCNIKWKRP